jgi:hypothetical protein
MSVERSRHPTLIEVAAGAEPRRLIPRMHAGIGSPGPEHAGSLAVDLFRCAFEFRLD